MLETNIDDVSAEIIGHCLAELMNRGALDAYTTSIAMKKNRPATKLSVICKESRRSALEEVIFSQTATLGIRRWVCDRAKLVRSMTTVRVREFEVAGKRIEVPGGADTFVPEYESCAQVASQLGLSVREVMDAAKTAYQKSV